MTNVLEILAWMFVGMIAIVMLACAIAPLYLKQENDKTKEEK